MLYPLLLVFLSLLTPTTNHTTIVEGCKDYTTSRVDDITGKLIIFSTEKIQLIDDAGEHEAKMSISRQGFEMIMGIVHTKGECFNTNTRVQVTLDDGKKMMFKSSNPDNCKGLVTLSFGGIYEKMQELMDLANGNITSIKVIGKDGPIEFNLKADKRIKLKSTLDCILSGQ